MGKVLSPDILKNPSWESWAFFTDVIPVTAVARVQSLAWELQHAKGVAKKKKNPFFNHFEVKEENKIDITDLKIMIV